MVLRAININKKISGRTILSNINLELTNGKIYGICGKNGSGKTMLIRALSGLMEIESGQIFLDDKELHKDYKILPNMGITIENAGMFPSLTGYENLKYLADINKKIKHKNIVEAINRVGLDPKDRRIYNKYSLGMKQRIAIAQAIMEKPDILFLDEATNGLDEEGIKLIHQVIMEEKKRGALIILVSHRKEECEELCDEFFCIKEGRICSEQEITY